MNSENIEQPRTEPCVLPLDIIEEEILSRLPVKSLLKFRCISKSWRRLIGSEKFIKTHLQNSTKNKAFPHHRAILTFANHELKQSSLPPLLTEAEAAIHKPSPFADGLSIPPAEEIVVVGCCNGLVCILHKRRLFSLVNPTTRISKELPYDESDGYELKSGFGWDESSNDYKVFALMRDDSGSVVGKIYSLKTNSWKIVKHKDFCFTHRPGLFLRGKLHWRGSTWEIVTLDLKTEEFGTMELPSNHGRWFYTSLGVVGGSLSLMRVYEEAVVDVWVMKEYGVKESWEKMINMLPVVYEPYEARLPSAPIGLGPNGVKESWEKVINMLPVVYEPYEARLPLAPIGLGPNGEILLIYGSALLVYNPKKDCVLRPYKKISDLCGMSLYVESLVSPL